MKWVIRGLYAAALILAVLVGVRLWAIESAYRYAPQTLAGMSVGPENAAVTVVEFLDYRCSACRASHPIVQQAMAEFPDVRFTFRHLPIFGSQSIIEGQMALTAARHGKFFEMHDILITREQPVTEEEISVIARQIGLDDATFREEMRQDGNAREFYRTLDIQEALNIPQTPAFLINRTLFYPTQGPLTIEDLRAAINAAR